MSSSGSDVSDHLDHLDTLSPAPQSPVRRVRFDNNRLASDSTKRIVQDFLEWQSGGGKFGGILSPIAALELGFDQWSYALENKPFPNSDQIDALKRQLILLIHSRPRALILAIEGKKLLELLGSEFAWVETPKAW